LPAFEPVGSGCWTHKGATPWGSLSTPAGVVPAAIGEEAWQEVGVSFERFCLTADIVALAGMREGMPRLCGVRYGREDGKDGQR
jgi:hypothetical protein